MAATPSGKGYWLVARDGGIFSFGDAAFAGSTGAIRLNKPIFAMTASPTGRGYWFVASDGGVFTFGDAQFLGSTGGAPPGTPVTGMASTPNGRGYWLSTRGGHVYAFGNATLAGNIASPVNAPFVGIVAAPGGYRLVDSRGNVALRGVTDGRAHISAGAPLVAAG
jgi:ribosomal protein L24E